MKHINLTTPINQLGFGVVGLNALRGLQQLGYEVALWPLGPIDYPQEYQSAIERALHASQTFDPQAPSLRISIPSDFAHHVGRGLRVAITYFERDRLTATEVHHLTNQDVVIASSVWMQELLRRQIRGPRIAIASPGVEHSIFSDNILPPLQLNDPGCKSEDKPPVTSGSSASPARMAIQPAPRPPTTFLVVGKWEVRKGHDVLPAIFQSAFTPQDNFRLVLMTVNPFLSQQQHAAWCRSFAKLGDKVEIHHQRLPDQRAVALAMAQADCGVFLSRAEGWNLDAAEMLAMGKHIIITNFAAHTEFVNRDNAWLVDIHELEPAYDGCWFDGFGQWAKLGDSQLRQAVAHVRAVHQLKQTARLTVNLAGQHSMRSFTWQSFAERIIAACSPLAGDGDSSMSTQSPAI